MKYTMMPVIDIYELRDEIEKMFPDVDFDQRRLDGGLGLSFLRIMAMTATSVSLLRMVLCHIITSRMKPI